MAKKPDPTDDETVIEIDEASLAPGNLRKDTQDDDPIVEIIAEADEKPAVETKKIIEPEEGLETLRTQLAEEKAGRERDRILREAAEARANTASQNVAKAQTDVQDTNIQLVTTALETTKQALAMAKADYANAMATGEFAAAADAQEAIAEQKYKQQQLEYGLQQLKAQPKPQPEVVRHSDPVEDFVTTNGFTPKSADWVRRHPTYATNPRMTQRMLAAHNLAVTEDLEPESPEYFNHIENTLGISRRQPEVTDDALSDAAVAVSSRSAPPAAPVSRSGNGTGRPGTIRLTAAEVEAAEMSGMTPAEYAQEKLRIEKENIH